MNGNGLTKGLKNSLNAIREISSTIYTQYVPIIDDDTDISKFAEPILNVPQVMNEFITALVNRIVYTAFENKYFNNPLKVLEGDRIPLGYAGQEIYINPAKGRQFNVNDFAGLLQKYEADVKVQYMTVNVDLQYPVSVTRAKLKQAFVSWTALDTFIANLTNSLYNGAYIDSFNLTKGLVSSAYKSGNAIIDVIDEPSTEATAKSFITKARQYYLNFALPSTKYNAWYKIGGYGRPITTWTESDDIVFLIRNDVLAYIDVNVLASAFHIEESKLMGRILPVDNFNIYSDEGDLVFDGSKIIGLMADKSWFRIKEQDMYLDEFYNANNRVWNYYLNMTKMFQYSVFSNAIIFATEAPVIPVESITADKTETTITVGNTETIGLKIVPATATNVDVSVNNANATAELKGNSVSITGVTAGTSKVTIKGGNISSVINVTVQ